MRVKGRGDTRPVKGGGQFFILNEFITMYIKLMTGGGGDGGEGMGSWRGWKERGKGREGLGGR